MEALTNLVQALYAHPVLQDVLAAVQVGKLTDLQAITSNPTTATAAGTVVLMLACWLGQVTTGYWSWVDRVWVRVCVPEQRL